MTLVDEALTLYRDAATFLSNVSQRRIDLLQSASGTLPPSPTLFEGYCSFGPNLSICVPRGTRATFTFQRPHGEGALIQTDLPEWMTLEGTLPDDLTDATECYVEIEAQSGGPLHLEAFIRETDADGRLVNGPAKEFSI